MKYREYNTNEAAIIFSPTCLERRQECCATFSKEILNSLQHPWQILDTYIRVFEDNKATLVLKLPNKSEIKMNLQEHEWQIPQY
jgi:hypothetical protein